MRVLGSPHHPSALRTRIEAIDFTCSVSAIAALPGASLHVSHCAFDARSGISASEPRELHVHDCSFFQSGVRVEGHPLFREDPSANASVQIMHSEFTQSQSGVVLCNTSEVLLRDLTLTQCRWGVELALAHHIRLGAITFFSPVLTLPLTTTYVALKALDTHHITLHGVDLTASTMLFQRVAHVSLSHVHSASHNYASTNPWHHQVLGILDAHNVTVHSLIVEHAKVICGGRCSLVRCSNATALRLEAVRFRNSTVAAALPGGFLVLDRCRGVTARDARWDRASAGKHAAGLRVQECDAVRLEAASLSMSDGMPALFNLTRASMHDSEILQCRQPLTTTRSSLELHNTQFIRCSPSAALSAQDSMLALHGCRMIQNQGTIGGALALYSTPAVIESCHFTRNQASLRGGAIFATGQGERAALTVRNSVFNWNQIFAPKSATGGAICFHQVIPTNHTTPLVLEHTRFIRNRCPSTKDALGGAVFLDVDMVHFPVASVNTMYRVDACNFERNFAHTGGAIFMEVRSMCSLSQKPRSIGPLLHATDTEFNVNTAEEEGGALFLKRTSARLERIKSLFNTALHDKAAFLYSILAHSLELLDSNCTRDSAPKVAGAMAIISPRAALVQNCRFTQNQGGVFTFTNDFFPDGSMVFRDCVVQSPQSEHFAMHFTEFQNVLLQRVQFKEIPSTAVYADSGKLFSLDSCQFSDILIHRTATSGPVVYLSGIARAEVAHSSFSECRCSGDASAIHWGQGSRNSELIVNHCLFEEALGTAIYLRNQASIHNATFRNCRAPAQGGAIAVERAHAEITSSLFQGCSSNEHGGALAVTERGATLMMANTVFRECHAKGKGGAVWARNTKNRLYFSDCDFRGCRAGDTGGAVSVSGCEQARFASSRFTENTAIFRGGALDLRDTPDVILTSVSLEGNQAESGGAASLYRTVRIDLIDTRLLRNTAHNGGGLALRNATLYAFNLTALGNVARMSGGAVIIEDSPGTELRRCTFDGNQAVILGGAIYLRGTASGRVACVSSEFQRNQAAQGGAILAEASSGVEYLPLHFSSCTLRYNEASDKGGALWAHRVCLESVNTTYAANQAVTLGGAIGMELSRVHLDGDRLLDNRCTLLSGKGGAINLKGALPSNSTSTSTPTSTWKRVAVARNAAWGGGGVHLRDCAVSIEDGSVIEDNWIAHADRAAAEQQVLMLGAGILAEDRAEVRLSGATRVRNNTGGGVAVVSSSLAVSGGTEIVGNAVLARVRNMTAEISVFCDQGRVWADASSRVPWLLCGRSGCNVVNGSCHMPAPRVTRATPQHGTIEQLQTIRVIGSNILNYRSGCRLEALRTPKSQRSSDSLAQSSPSCCNPASAPASHDIISLQTEYVSPTELHCFLTKEQVQGRGQATWHLRVTNDGNVWSSEEVAIKIDPPMLWAGVLSGFLGVLAIVAVVIVCLCYRFQRLRRASRIELSQSEKKISFVDLDDLRLIKRIGVGSCGEVFKGSLHGTPVAVKRMFPTKAAEAASQKEFEHEVAMLRTLRHPNVVLFIGATSNAPHYIVTEYMDRGTLFDLLHSEVALSLEQVHRMALDAARGMNYLHTLSPPIIHRDFKSPNLLVTANLVVKVADFGLSRLTDDNKTMTACGTPAWTAPEVLRGSHYSLKADVYSYGVVLFELLTRQLPYPSNSHPMQVVLGVTQGLRPALPADTPEPYKSIALACWQEDAALRPSFLDIVAVLENPQTRSHSGPEPEPLPEQPQCTESLPQPRCVTAPRKAPRWVETTPMDSARVPLLGSVNADLS